MRSDREHGIRSKAIAFAEVLLAFGITHLSFRAFKRFTTLGQLEYQHEVSLSPSLAMIVVALGLIALRRRRLSDFAVTLRPLPESLNAGLVAVLVYAAVGAVALACGLRIDRTWSDPVNGTFVAALNLLVSALMLVVLRWAEPGLGRVPGSIGVAILGAIVVAYGALQGTGDKSAAAVSVGLVVVIGAAIAEELFFRGYAQSRLNEAFGRPWRVLGVAFGPGLFIAALLFGLIHLLNPYDYFRGEGHLAWWWGIAMASSLFFGAAREDGQHRDAGNSARAY